MTKYLEPLGIFPDMCPDLYLNLGFRDPRTGEETASTEPPERSNIPRTCCPSLVSGQSIQAKPIWEGGVLPCSEARDAARDITSTGPEETGLSLLFYTLLLTSGTLSIPSPGWPRMRVHGGSSLVSETSCGPLACLYSLSLHSCN